MKSSSALAAADGCSQPTMSAQVARLEEAGLVARTTDPDDARRSRITLTTAGRESLAEVRTTNGAWAAALLADHSASDIRTAVAVLHTLTEGAR